MKFVKIYIFSSNNSRLCFSYYQSHYYLPRCEDGSRYKIDGDWFRRTCSFYLERTFSRW